MMTEIALVIFIYMSLVFIIAQIISDNSIVDIFWSIGFILIALFSLLQSTEFDLRKIIVSTLVVLWGLRLSAHIFFRNQGRGEDFRYKAWRETWNFFVLRSYFQIFMLQGFFMLIIASPVYFINYLPGVPLGLWDSAGLFLFGAGFFIEAVSDYQLMEFKKDPANKGKIITTGLWQISRHPNYFGESLVWWGIALYAVSLPMGWYTLISPVVLTLLLRFVSGVPMLERKYKGRPDWEAYASKTAPFVPFVKFL
jgi:steroid 5-alpha reductase family enzyme